ncbi:DinB family protein [Fulvivirga maritima]|uniref:DinB family protein n=1 Tax=Fulvivirga maritima TaxID=2904247 RepID=UPI001F267422|nr:DinB family protein [Fulvivirga maritima]UII28940.1 DinB family protein [Fulvivirga maritima]
MELIPLLLSEMQEEAVTTKKMLERIPQDQLDFKPHEKSMLMRYLATHIAELPTWVSMALNSDGIDFDQNNFEPTEIKSTEELMKIYEDSLASGMETLKKADESTFKQEWIMRKGDTILYKDDKYGVMRMALCQIVHHRAQLGVYLRLLNIPIPGSYGPSADENQFN